MSELDNGADIGTSLTISRANLKTLMALPPADRARIMDALLYWSLLGEEGEPIANPCQRMLLDDLIREAREGVEYA